MLYCAIISLLRQITGAKYGWYSISYYEGDGNFSVNWILLSKPYSPDKELLQALTELNLWEYDKVIQESRENNFLSAFCVY